MPGERLLAVARDVGGELAVATGRALYHESGRSWSRLGWGQVDQVVWDDQRHVLALTGLTPRPRPAPCCSWPATGACRRGQRACHLDQGG